MATCKVEVFQTGATRDAAATPLELPGVGSVPWPFGSDDAKMAGQGAVEAAGWHVRSSAFAADRRSLLVYVDRELPEGRAPRSARGRLRGGAR